MTNKQLAALIGAIGTGLVGVAAAFTGGSLPGKSEPAPPVPVVNQRSYDQHESILKVLRKVCVNTAADPASRSACLAD